MVLSQLAEYFSSTHHTRPLNHVEDGKPCTNPLRLDMQHMRLSEEDARTETADLALLPIRQIGGEDYRPPYAHAMLAGGLGGLMGDMMMHSLDTVKTRQQGDPNLPPKYTSLGRTYWTILRQEGIVRGLYGGVAPAFWGSFAGTFLFFGGYEWSKRYMIDHGVNPTLAYLSAGFFADLVISPLYVPTEVLKTRLQLQGRYNNPYFNSGYNYRGTMHALRSIYRTEGLGEFFSGYKATIFRDLPWSALTFAFYEQEQRWVKEYYGPGQDIGIFWETFTGASAGAMAGVITCPMDVVKTRIQTELDPAVAAASKQKRQAKREHKSATLAASRSASKSAASTAAIPRRTISTAGPSTTLARHGHVSLDTESVIQALRVIYRTEGFAGWFRGVGAKLVWTGMQSGTMLVVYQKMLKYLDAHPLSPDHDGLRGID